MNQESHLDAADEPGRPLPPKPGRALRQSLVMGGLCSVVGLLAGLWLWRTATASDYGAFAIAAPLAAFVAGAGTWWLLRARRGGAGAWAGAATGALAALVGHWICWYGLMVHAFVCHAVGVCPAAVGGPPMNPLEALSGASVYTLVSLFVIGWFTVPAGAIAGAVLGWRAGRDTLGALGS